MLGFRFEGVQFVLRACITQQNVFLVVVGVADSHSHPLYRP